ncbi:MAG: nucleotidyltransferase family protein [Prevotella sp.]|nr:nucleotidyltransferase family protein [Prevotella sp.]
MEVKVCFEFLQVAIGNRESLSDGISDADWHRLFEFCKKQALIGVGFTAVEKLHAMGVVCPATLRMQWMALALQIEKRNALLNEQCRQLTDRYKHDGFSTCILKGQGNCINYPEDLRKRRQCGDIDVWMAPLCDISVAVQTGSNDVEYAIYNGCRAVREYVRMQHRLAGNNDMPKQNYHHIDAPTMDGTEVEVHFRAAHLYSPLRNWRLQKWMNEHADECMKNKTHLGFAMPTSSVNVLYQMTHMYKHHIDGGLGFRHLMDYYYALRVWHNDVMECKDLQSQGMWCEGLGTPIMSNAEVMSVIRSFGMTKFAAAVMYVLHKVFDMSSHYYICNLNEKEGKKLLAEIMNSGNFGHYDSEKPNVYQHRFQYHIWKFKRIFRLAMSYPEEALWEPVFRGWRKILRVIHY